MRKLILSVLVCISALLASNEELRSFVVNDASIEYFNALPKFTDTSKVFSTIDANIQCEYWNGETIEELFNDSLRKYGPFAQIINEACSYKELLDSFDIEELKQFIRDKYRIVYDSSTVSKFLGSLKDIPFADSVMMRDYITSLFAASMGVCYDTSNTYTLVKEVAWGDEEMVELFKNTYKDAFDSSLIDRCIKAKDVKFALKKPFSKNAALKKKLESVCNLNRELTRRFKYVNCTDARWSWANEKVKMLYSDLLQSTVDSVIRTETPFSDTLPVSWKANDCGCSLRRDLNGDVYAIFPYWLAKEGGNTLDFSVITRIAYYGISADDNGKLRMPSGSTALWYFNKKDYSEFVNVAHRHDVKVDWIIAKNDWSGIGGDTAKMNSFFRNLVDQVDSLVSKKNNSLFNQFVDKVSFVQGDAGLRGDGVTIWFKNYPRDAEAARIFKRHFRKLQKRLRSSNERAFVNLMMDMHDLAEKTKSANDSVYQPERNGIYSYQFFMGLLSDSVEKKLPMKELTHDKKNFLIVLNNEPVSHNKLVMYNDLNHRLGGNYRTAVLHAVVPMLWFDYRQWDQFEDDASFYNTAFYSLGIAPYGVDVDSSSEFSLGDILLDKFEKEDASHKVQGRAAAFFCTYRWAFRLANTLVYLLVFVLLLCYFAICRLNTFLNEHLLGFVLFVLIPPLLTTVVISNFDPEFIDFTGNVKCWTCFVVIVLTVIAITLLRVKNSSDLPKRKEKARLFKSPSRN